MSKKLNPEEKAAKKAAAVAKKEAAKAAKATEKASRPKLVRTSPPFRKYSASPAGHFADSIAAFQRRLTELAKKTARWGAPVAAAIAALTAPSEVLRNEFETMAAANFRPKKGGMKRTPTFKAGEIVGITADALALLNKDFPSLTPEHTIIVAHSVADEDKSIPLCVYDETKENKQGQFLGRVSYKLIEKVAIGAPAAETETAAA